jgi:hypothetical protein
MRLSTRAPDPRLTGALLLSPVGFYVAFAALVTCGRLVMRPAGPCAKSNAWRRSRRSSTGLRSPDASCDTATKSIVVGVMAVRLHHGGAVPADEPAANSSCSRSSPLSG